MQVADLASDKAHLLLEGDEHVELWVVHDWSHGRNVDSLTVAHFALTPLVVEEVRTDRHDLGLEEVSNLAPELGPPLSKVQGLGQISWHLEREWNALLANSAYISWEAFDEFCFLPSAALPDMRISLAFVTVVNFLAGVDQLKFELDAVGGDRLVRVDVDHAFNRVVSVESTIVIDESDCHVGSIELGLLLSHIFFLLITIFKKLIFCFI